MAINIDKTLYNNVVTYKIEAEELITDLYSSFNNFTMEEKQSAIEIIFNLNIIIDEYAKYIIIYNNAVASEAQTDEYISIEGDTFQKIAQVMTGDFNNWKQLMDFNEIKDPYLDAGTTLLIPRDL